MPHLDGYEGVNLPEHGSKWLIEKVEDHPLGRSHVDDLGNSERVLSCEGCILMAQSSEYFRYDCEYNEHHGCLFDIKPGERCCDIESPKGLCFNVLPSWTDRAFGIQQAKSGNKYPFKSEGPE